MMADIISDNNKRIAKNTILLYIRMVITMCIGLFTSRIILQNLGVVDYGINNVVAGMVTMFTFFNSTLASGTQRFITFALGENNINKMSLTFSTTFIVHLIMAIILSAFILIVGLWFMEKELSIPPERMEAAYWVFFCSTITVFLNTTQVPYMSTLIAHENMGIYAYMAIYDALAKLVVAFSLMYSIIDNLKLYAVLSLIISATSLLIYRIYCTKKYSECRITWKLDYDLLKSVLVFSGWNVFGCAAVMLNNQGVNILLNMFFGPVINAARGIANTLNGIVLQFVYNFLTAVQPQIVKYHASNDNENMFELINNTSRYAGLMVLFLLLPLCFEVNFLLKLWLGVYPEYTVFFTRIILIQTLVQTISRPIVTGIHAVGKMKLSNVISGSVLLSIVPISWLLLKYGVSVYVVLIVNIIPWILETYIISSILCHYTGFSVKKFYIFVYGNVLPLGILSSLPLFAIYFCFEEGICRFLVMGTVSVIVTGTLIYYLGLDSSVRLSIRTKIKEKISLMRTLKE